MSIILNCIDFRNEMKFNTNTEMRLELFENDYANKWIDLYSAYNTVGVEIDYNLKTFKIINITFETTNKINLIFQFGLAKCKH